MKSSPAMLGARSRCSGRLGLLRSGAGEARSLRRVDHRVQSDGDFGRHLDVERRCNAGADALDAADDRVAHRVLVVAQRAADGHPPGNLIGGGAAFDGAEREHGGVERIDVARDDRLQRHHQMSGSDHRIAASGAACRRGRHGRRSVSVTRPPDAITTPSCTATSSGGEAGPVVETENLRHRKTVEQPVGDHRLGAAKTFLGRLEHEMRWCRSSWCRRRAARRHRAATPCGRHGRRRA